MWTSLKMEELILVMDPECGNHEGDLQATPSTPVKRKNELVIRLAQLLCWWVHVAFPIRCLLTWQRRCVFISSERRGVNHLWKLSLNRVG